MNIFDELTRSSTDQKLPLGTVRSYGENSYRYIQVSASSTSAVTNGAVVYATMADNDVVTTAGVKKTFNLVRGVGIGAIAKSSFGWVQTWGDHSAVATNGDDDIATGDAIIGATGDGIVNSVGAGTAPTHKVIGFATAADVDTLDTVAVHIEIAAASE